VSSRLPRRGAVLVFSLVLLGAPAVAAERDADLLEALRANGSITQEQFDALSADDGTSATDSAEGAEPLAAAGDSETSDGDEALDPRVSEQVAGMIAQAVEEAVPVKASYGSKGFRLETRDGNWQTNLQWRFQGRLTHPTRGDPRQVDDFKAKEQTTFELRRVRMKIGGHGYKPWLKYYFEVDLQPTRDTDDDNVSTRARVIDWRIDLSKWEAIGLRVGQWKIDYNRERVDSSGRQQFVERSIVNRIFTIDRQMGVSLRGRLFNGTHADMRYYAGVFTGEGRGVQNDDNNLMYAGRLQWNFLGRDLALRQTDVERTELPTGTLAFGGATHTGRCTRWSSSSCGNLDGFERPVLAEKGQFRVHQAVQELAFKWQGFSFQQEAHWKRVIDRSFASTDGRRESDFYGLYAQMGYFFNEVFDRFPEPLELAFRYAKVWEPNEIDVRLENERQEFTTAANWFFAGHNNKLTLDYSYLTLEDGGLRRKVHDNRVRFQWDVSF